MTAVVETRPEARYRPLEAPSQLSVHDRTSSEGQIATLVEPTHPADVVGELTDDELTAQALAADPDRPIDDDVPPWSPTATGLMPDWYMPASLPRHRGGWRAWVAVAVIVGLVAINAAGLCITYGHLVIA
jgi:hypothetical protein